MVEFAPESDGEADEAPAAQPQGERKQRAGGKQGGGGGNKAPKKLQLRNLDRFD